MHSKPVYSSEMEDTAQEKLQSGIDKLSQIERRLKGYLETPNSTNFDSK
jgi:hypothetical protein